MHLAKQLTDKCQQCFTSLHNRISVTVNVKSSMLTMPTLNIRNEGHKMYVWDVRVGKVAYTVNPTEAGLSHFMYGKLTE